MPPHTPSVETILAEAVEIASGADRQAFVERRCAGDAALRERVERLIRNHFEAGSFLERPALEVDPEATADPQAPPVGDGPGAVVGPYRLREQIGEGGMGLVFVADQHQPIRRRVALKLIKPGMDSKQVVARFEAERQALALMDHPNIATIHDGGATPDGRPYFVMELVRGTPITAYCDQHRLPPRKRLELFLDVCSAVQHAHQKGVIHRDIKPSNVLVSHHDVTPVVKVIDFGIAKATAGHLTDKTVYTAFAQMVGTPLYMSPEQAGLSDLDVDTRSDVYSLGVLLYELLTGTTPFDGETLKKAGYDEMRRIIREEEPPRPSTRVSTLAAALTTTAAAAARGTDARGLAVALRGELDWVVMKALEKDRGRRYDTASAFAQDVERHLRDEPVLACPPSAGYVLTKFVRRKKAPLAVAAGILTAAVTMGVMAGGFLLEKATHQARVEEEATSALGEAERWRQQKQWPAALSAARRAEGLLRTRPGNARLVGLVDQEVKDLTLVTELEAIFTDRLARFAERFHADLADLEIDSRYARAFRDAGIDVQELGVPVAAERIRERPVRAELAAAIDDWTANRHGTMGKEDPFWRQLQELANAVDPDPFRMNLRKLWAGFQVNEGKKLFAAPELIDQPMPVLHALAWPLLMWERNGRAWQELLLKLQRQRPDDFEINLSLSEGNPDPIDDLRFSTSALAIRPDNIRARYAVCEALHRQKRYDEAILSFQEAIRRSPKVPEYHSGLGTVLADKGLRDQAVAAYRESLRLRPEDGYTLLALGAALGSQGRLDEAADAFQTALRIPRSVAAYREGRMGLSPGNRAEALVNLGTVRAMQGKTKEALAAWQDAVRADANSLSARLRLAWFQANAADLGLREPKRAIQHAEKATALAPTNARAWNVLGVARYRNGNTKAAVEALTKSVKMSNGGDGNDFFFLAMANRKLGHDEEARRWYEQAVQWTAKNDPNDEELRRVRAEAGELLGVAAAPDAPKGKP